MTLLGSTDEAPTRHRRGTDIGLLQASFSAPGTHEMERTSMW